MCVRNMFNQKSGLYILSSLLAHLIGVMDVYQLDRGDVITQKTSYGLDIYPLGEETGSICVPEIGYGVAGKVPVNQAVDVV